MIGLLKNSYETRMTTFKKVKLKISDVKTNIEKDRVAANYTEYHTIPKSSLF